MTSSSLLSPTLLHASAVFTVALGVLMIAVHTVILHVSAQRTSLPASTQFAVSVIAAALFASWFAWAVLAVGDWVTVPAPLPVPGRIVQQPALLVDMAAMVAVGVIVLFTSRTIKQINAATPPAWLIGAQFYRVAGAMFLWPFLAGGALPAGFALPAGIGDMLTGLAAPFVAMAIARDRPGARAWVVAWNCFGILDLVVAVAAAVVTQAPNIGRFPLVIVPLFLGPPLGLLTHIYSLRNLHVTRTAEKAAATGRRVATA